jgi:lysophospholipase L1-like esterase
MLRTLAAAVLAFFITSASAAAEDVTAFGDSFTAGSGSWFNVLDLGERNFAVSGAVCNPAFTTVSGKRLSSQIARWRAAGRPTNDWVVVFMGINDIIKATDTFGPSRTAYVAALKALRGAGAKLILVTAPNLGKVPRYAGTSQAATMTSKTRTWNGFVRRQATAFSAGLVDLFNKLPSADLYTSDGLHPNAKGQAIIAKAIGAKL